MKNFGILSGHQLGDLLEGSGFMKFCGVYKIFFDLTGFCVGFSFFIVGGFFLAENLCADDADLVEKH